jgi:hypothetical protein
MSNATSPSVLARPDYIDDGYNLPFSIPASDAAGAIHGPLSGIFRPCYGMDRESLLDAGGSNAKYLEVLLAALPKYVSKWSLTDRNGKPVDVTALAIERLHPALRNKLADIVFWGSQAEVETSLKN